MTINVIVADQERIFADALVSRLSTEGDMEVVLAVQVTAPGPWLVAGRNAEVMVLDGDLPGEAANRLCARLAGAADPTRVVMLSSTSEPERILEAIRAGAAAWLSKDESVELLLDVIRGVARGETWLPPRETGRVLWLLMREADRQRENDRLLATLTPRQRAVLACMADGAGHRETAEMLHMSVNTVRTHLRNLLAKLGAHSALEAVALTRDNTGQPTRPHGGPANRHLVDAGRGALRRETRGRLPDANIKSGGRSPSGTSGSPRSRGPVGVFSSDFRCGLPALISLWSGSAGP